VWNCDRCANAEHVSDSIRDEDRSVGLAKSKDLFVLGQIDGSATGQYISQSLIELIQI
jgi:hypothetical protein